jgi:hypothetical protein
MEASLVMAQTHIKPTIRIKSNPNPNPNALPPILIRRRPEQLDELEGWTLSYIIDEMCFQLIDVKLTFCMLTDLDKEARMEDLRNLGRGVLRRLYEEQARYKIYRIPVFRPPPVFVVHLKHLDDRLKKELATLDKNSRDFVMKEAIGRICEQVDKRFYLLNAKPLLKWRLEN